MKHTCRLKSKRAVLKFISKRKKASGLILTMILVFILITFIVTIGEFYRIHILQQDIEYQLQRTVNCAVEYAMGDSYRQDKIVNLDISAAKKEFFRYLKNDVGLDASYCKFVNSRVEYTLFFSQIGGTSKPAKFTVEGYAEANSLFAFLVGEIRIPFHISSTNFRVD